MSFPITRHSVARQFTRNMTKSSKVPVQLLQDFPPHGVKGEVIDVAPAFMRNVLHVDNKACYITKTQGPRIPVVVPKRAAVPKVKKVVQKEKTEESTPVLSLDELSKLFANMKTAQDRPEVNFAASAEQGEPVIDELAEIPQSLSFSFEAVQGPINASALAGLIQKNTGVEVPLESMQLLNKGGSQISEITRKGEYAWKVTGQNKLTVRKTVIFF